MRLWPPPLEPGTVTVELLKEVTTSGANGESAPAALVAIGAAAMELGVVAELLANLPATFPAAVLLAMHSTNPGQAAPLLDALTRGSSLRCAYAADYEQLAQGRVYLAPADKHLLVQGNRIRVVFGPKENSPRPALDPLFRTAAHEWGKRAVGVVLCGLSGQITDGLSGLWMIKESGGTVVVPHATGTDPAATSATAIFQRVSADYTPTPSELPSLLMKLANDRNPAQ